MREKRRKEKKREENMIETIIYINFIVSVIFTLCYFYQFVYVLVGMVKKGKEYSAVKQHRYAIVVSARNEETVVGELIESIKEQTYPSELIDVYVVADNCTDNTAKVAREAGAMVYERFDTEMVGKGYALNWLFEKIEQNHADKKYEGYIVFDADNIISPQFVEEINKVFDSGYRIVTSYRNSKNYGHNWITAGYSLWFLREAKFLNNPRMMFGTSCAISGTGFLVSTEIIRENGGWIHYLLTEDIEFTTHSIIKGEKIGYCEKAVLYDEQPTTFKQSYVQRLRWSKGFYQVFYHYGKRLINGISKGSFSCYDMTMTLMPAMLLTLICSVINTIAVAVGLATGSEHLYVLVETLGKTFFSFYAVFFVLGLITTIWEWKQIHCSKVKKILYTFTFPLFMFTYVPISIIALFKKVKWVPITHSVTKSASDLCEKV